MAKRYISAQQLLDDSFNLAVKVLQSNFQPNFIVGVWRGGTPIGIAVQELLAYQGIDSDHIAIRTSFYGGIDERHDEVKVYGLDYLVEKLKPKDRLLLVDDVFDSGRSIQQIISDLEEQCGTNMPQLKVATPYFKPGRNQTNRVPDYYLFETEEWLVFPHELMGLSMSEILKDKPGVEALHKLLSETDH